MQLLIATTNPGKVTEIREVIGHLEIQILGLHDLGITTDVEETGQTYFDNAKIKAEFFFKEAVSNIPTIAEDSGIVVDALKDQLGVQTRRWGAGAKASDQEWIDYFLQVMANHPEQRQARFISHLYFTDGTQSHDFCGETEGVITETLEADIQPGIPISACFKPLGSNKVYSAMTKTEKNQISHRGKATHAFKDFLETIL